MRKRWSYGIGSVCRVSWWKSPTACWSWNRYSDRGIDLYRWSTSTRDLDPYSQPNVRGISRRHLRATNPTTTWRVSSNRNHINGNLGHAMAAVERQRNHAIHRVSANLCERARNEFQHYQSTDICEMEEEKIILITNDRQSKFLTSELWVASEDRKKILQNMNRLCLSTFTRFIIWMKQSADCILHNYYCSSQLS